MSSLDQPTSPNDIYLAKGSDVSVYRPLMTGDVFDGIAIPGVDGEAGLAMLLAHPCSMRKGAHVRDHMQMARVDPGTPIPLSSWNGNYGAMPLPELLGPGDLRHRATFELAGRVPTASLASHPRVACLETRGITLLLQRVVFSQARVVVDLDTLHQAIAHVLEEADLLEEWLTSRCPQTDEAAVRAAIHQEEERFDGVMSEAASGASRRQRLLDPKERAGVRRAVREAMSEG